jgi:hypothetical protein
MDVHITMHFETGPFRRKDNMPDFWEASLVGILAVKTNDFQGVL